MVAAQWFQLGAVLDARRAAVTLAFLAIFDLFLLRVWWQEVPIAALITNFVFIALLISVAYVKVLPKLTALFGQRQSIPEERGQLQLVDQATVRQLTKKLQEWLAWPTEFASEEHSIINLLVLAILLDQMVSLLNVYLLVAIVVNVRLAVLIINARSGSKFEYTFNDLKAIVGEIVGGALAKLPRYTGSC